MSSYNTFNMPVFLFFFNAVFFYFCHVSFSYLFIHMAKANAIIYIISLLPTN